MFFFVLDNEALYVIQSLIKNTGLTALFIIPHSILPKLKQYIITDFELNVLGRTIYVLITSLSLIVSSPDRNSMVCNLKFIAFSPFLEPSLF